MIDEQQAKDIAKVLNVFHPDWWKAGGRFYPSYITTSPEEYRRTGDSSVKSVYLIWDGREATSMFGPGVGVIAGFFAKDGRGQLYVDWGETDTYTMDCYGEKAVEVFEYWLSQQYAGESLTTEGA